MIGLSYQAEIIVALIVVLAGVELGFRYLDRLRWRWTLRSMLKLMTIIGVALGIFRAFSLWLGSN
jgi:predicted permease